MIGIANDHNGFEVKQELTKFLEKIGYNVIDYGCDGSKVDYPPLAFSVGEAVRDNKIKFGILICGTGIGMSIACNKVKGVRCAKVDNTDDARLSREHNNANVLAVSGRLPIETLKDVVKTFIETQFSTEERHHKRVEMIDNYDN